MKEGASAFADGGCEGEEMTKELALNCGKIDELRQRKSASI